MPKTKLKGDHGQSFLIRTEKEQILLDVGTSGKKLLHNMQLLGVDSNAITTLILSHGHYDHTGGLPALLAARTTEKKLRIVAHPDIFIERRVKVSFYSNDAGAPKLSEEEMKKIDLQLNKEPQKITSFLRTTGEISDRPYQTGVEPRVQSKRDGVYSVDQVWDDNSIILETKEGQVIVTGCSHAGILNICKHAKDTSKAPIKAIIGGTHMANYSKEEVLKTGEIFVNKFDNPDLYMNHCTDKLPVKLLKTTKVIDILREKYGEKKIKNCYVGSKITYKV